MVLTLITSAFFIAALESFNTTVVISVISFSLASMATIIKVFGSDKKINDENLRNSPYLKSLEYDIKDKSEKLRLEIKDKEDKLNGIKEIVHTQHIEVEKLKVETKNSSKSLEELKQDNRDLVQRLDDLLKQFMDFMEG